jgi:hypothetical protein
MMFCSAFKESKESLITINDVTADAFEVVLNFMYTQSVKLQKILAASHMLQTNNLFDLFCKYIEEHASPRNCLGIWLLGKK